MFNFRCNLQTCWDLWWYGNPEEKCAPYRLIRGTDLLAADKKNKSELAKARKVMEELVTLLGATSAATLASMSVAERRSQFRTGIVALYRQLYPSRTMEEFDRLRFGDLTYLRVYDLMIDRTKSVYTDAT